MLERELSPFNLQDYCSYTYLMAFFGGQKQLRPTRDDSGAYMMQLLSAVI
jgi:hypothetical protein